MASNKKSVNKKSKTKKAAQAEQRRSNEINRIVGIVLFAVSIIFFFIAVVKGQGAWLFHAELSTN